MRKWVSDRPRHHLLHLPSPPPHPAAPNKPWSHLAVPNDIVHVSSSTTQQHHQSVSSNITQQTVVSSSTTQRNHQFSQVDHTWQQLTILGDKKAWVRDVLDCAGWRAGRTLSYTRERSRDGEREEARAREREREGERERASE